MFGKFQAKLSVWNSDKLAWNLLDQDIKQVLGEIMENNGFYSFLWPIVVPLDIEAFVNIGRLFLIKYFFGRYYPWPI